MKFTLPAIFASFVASASAATLVFDFGDTTQQTSSAPTNHITPVSAGVQNTITGAVDLTGAATTINLATTGFNGANLNGTTAPTGALAIFDPQTTRDSLFGNTATFGSGIFAKATLTFTGLDGTGGTLYSFEFGGSRTGVADNRETRYSILGLNSSVVDLNAANNTANTVIATGLIPTAGGQITIDVGPGPNNTNGTGFYYLGGLRVVSTAVPEPSSAVLGLLGALALLRRRR